MFVGCHGLEGLREYEEWVNGPFGLFVCLSASLCELEWKESREMAKMKHI